LTIDADISSIEHKLSTSIVVNANVHVHVHVHIYNPAAAPASKAAAAGCKHLILSEREEEQFSLLMHR
jgi:hypothetical protein